MQNAFSLHTLLTSPEATSTMATRLAPLLQAGDTFLLHGPIGAGKSYFARTLIQTRLAVVGIFEDVPSPTFTLVQTYNDTRCEIWHADLYRLTNIADIDELGLWEAFETAICLIEWPDRLGSFAPSGALNLTLKTCAGENHRKAHLWSKDQKWHDRLVGAGFQNDT